MKTGRENLYRHDRSHQVPPHTRRIEPRLFRALLELSEGFGGFPWVILRHGYFMTP